MFDWALFLVITAFCLPGILIVVPQSLNNVIKKMPPDKKIPPRIVLYTVSTLQSVIFVAAAAAIGTALAYRVGLEAPFFEALSSGGDAWAALQPQLLPSLIGGIGGAAVFLAAYYLYYRPRLEADTLFYMEDMRMSMGIWGRVLYGGIAEETLTRWGLMTLLVWLGNLIAGEANAAVVWIAIVISGVLFGLGHLPGYLAAGCRRSPMLISLMISLNLGASLVFGWLFWQYGLAAAMIAHALFHVCWLPFDLRFAGKPA